jgi:hypothetical protein
MNTETLTTKRPVTASQLNLREILERRTVAHREALDLVFHIERVQRLQTHLAARGDIQPQREDAALGV